MNLFKEEKKRRRRRTKNISMLSNDIEVFPEEIFQETSEIKKALLFRRSIINGVFLVQQKIVFI